MRRFSYFVKLGFLAFASLMLGVTSCTKDDASTKEAVDASKTEIPAEPGDRGMGQFQPENVYFDFDRSEIKEAAFANLDQLGGYLSKNATVRVELQGHADERGGEEYNLALGERRAFAVKNYLVKQGVEESRLKTVSFGKLRPAAPGHDSESWAKNRRVEFVIGN